MAELTGDDKHELDGMDEMKEGDFEADVVDVEETNSGTIFFGMLETKYNNHLKRDMLGMFACTSGGVRGELPEKVEAKLESGNFTLIELNDIMALFFEMKKFILRLSRETGTDIYASYMAHLIDLDEVNAEQCAEIDREFGITPHPDNIVGEIDPDGAVN